MTSDNKRATLRALNLADTENTENLPPAMLINASVNSESSVFQCCKKTIRLATIRIWLITLKSIILIAS